MADDTGWCDDAEPRPFQVLYARLDWRRARSEKLSEDERQLADEDLETAVAEVETQQHEQTPPQASPRRVAWRNPGNLLKDLLWIETVIEPASLNCPCRCGTMQWVGEERTERLDIIPALLRVIHCPSVHVYMHERGHCPAQVCLPRLRRGCHPSTGSRAPGRGRAANRGRHRACAG